jgi:hypothetical protein
VVDLANLLRPRPFAQQLTGLVTAVTAGTAGTPARATVDVGGGVVTSVACLSTVAPAVGDCVLLQVADRRMFVVGKLSHPTSPAPLPPAPGGDTAGTTVFPATAAGTYLAGVWRTDRTDVIQGPEAGGQANVGVWCYADIPAGTLAGATVTAGQVWLRRWPNTPAATVTAGLILHELAAPGAPPTVLDTAAVPALPAGWAGWVDLPTGWVADIVNPASSARGVGVSVAAAADYATFASLIADAQSGALSITWSR